MVLGSDHQARMNRTMCFDPLIVIGSEQPLTSTEQKLRIPCWSRPCMTDLGGRRSAWQVTLSSLFAVHRHPVELLDFSPLPPKRLLDSRPFFIFELDSEEVVSA